MTEVKYEWSFAELL